MPNQIRTILSVIIIMAFLLSSALVFGGQAAAADGERLDLPPIELAEKGNPKLDSQLNQLVSAETAEKAASFAQQSNIELVDERVRVIIECVPGELDATTEAATALGASVETSYHNLLQAVVPISQLTALADTASIRLVRLPWYPLPAVVSEGVALINADEWHTANYTGAGVKVAILDSGFTGYADLLGTDLPASVTTQSFYAGSDIEGYTVHGTACAEIVYDIAPDADFYLVNFGTEVEMGNAVDWLIAQGVDVISYSMGWPIGGPGDGTGTICGMVDDARAAGILWSSAIGNSAEMHWQGDFVDTLGDGWHEFDPGVDITININVNAGSLITVALKWDDTWGTSANDYDLYLADNTYTTVWGSTAVQDGNDDPWEVFSYTATYNGVYHIAIYRYSATETVNFHLYSYNHDLQEYQVASSSLAVPADSPNAMAVGAVDYSTPTTLESFSSRGPTKDGRIKPDLVAPDGVTSATYSPFYGTSASAPAVAGAAALVKERYPSYTPAQIQTFLEDRAVELGDAGKDNLFGSGRLDLGSPPEAVLPTMEAIVEAEGQYYNTAPVLSNFGFDDNEALDDGWYQMDSFAGTWIALFTDVGGTSWDSDNWTIPGFGALSEGSHTIYFKASDDADNVEGESGEWSWQFYKDTVSPTDPTGVSSTSHTPSVWSSDNTVDIAWTDATDNTSGLDGYSIIWDTNSNTIPDPTKNIEEGVQSANSTALADGNSHYFHIRSVDNAGNWQSTVHVGPFYIDTIPPTDPTGVSSTSHTTSVWSSDNTVDISWTDATDNTSGLDGYSILWDTSPTTIPDQTKDIEEGVQSANSSALADGNSHYFHIRSVDNAGNWQSTVHLGPFFIDTTPPTMEAIVEAEGQYYNTAPSLSNFGFDDNMALDDGWYQMNSFNGTWTVLFTDATGTSWDSDNWTIPGFDTLAEGSHTIYFMASDNASNVEGESGEWSWQFFATNLPVLSGGAVSPTSGYTSATFTYSVTYNDAENDAPSPITVSIDGGTSENMTAKAGQDVDFTNGEIYEYTTTGANLGVGTHTFQFAASDGTDNATGDIGSHSGPTVSSPPAPPGGGAPKPAADGGGGGLAGRFPVVDSISRDTGRFVEDVNIRGPGGKVYLYISQGTIGKTKKGVPLRFIETVKMEDPPDPPKDSNVIGPVYHFGPDGATFDPPISATFKYDPTLIPASVAEENLVVAFCDEETGEWVECPCDVDPDINTITAKVSHFTAFAILARTSPAEFTTTDLVITTDEVEIGEAVTITVLVTNTGDLAGSYAVNLKIDNLAVATKDVTLAGSASETVIFTTAKDVGGTYTVEVNGLSGTFTVKTAPVPAAFTTSDLTISPAEVDIGESVTISVLVTNTGDLAGSHTVTLKINNVMVTTKDVTLAGGASQTVTFTTAKDVAGTYTVTANGLSGAFTVKTAPAAVPAEPSNWWIISGIIAALVAAGLASYFWVRKRGEAGGTN